VSPPAKLAAFAVAAALTFSVAAFAGSRIDVHPGKPETEKAAMHTMAADGAGTMAPQPVRGLAVSDKGLTLELARRSAPRGKPFELAFRIADRGGRTVRDFDVEHTKRMHFIVVRRDMTGFQHLHPTENPDGTWSVPVTLPDAGSYRVFADFNHDGESLTLGSDLAVDGNSEYGDLPPQRTETRTPDGYEVAVEGESELAFTVTRYGEAVEVEPYLGAGGHLVALRSGDLAYAHVHPVEDAGEPATVVFDATLPSAGRYGLFFDFRHDGVVHTAAFTFDQGAVTGAAEMEH
jgi:hypothetical protein